MPKIRGIKPDFWTDDKVVELTPLARLLFLGMWNYACDNGHLEDKPLQLKMRILPADEVSVNDLIAELAANGRITRKDGVITVPKLREHQRVDKRYITTCEHCEPDESTQGESTAKSGKPSGKTSDSAVDTRGARGGHDVLTAGPLGDGDGDGDGDGELMVSSARKRAAQLAASFEPNQHHRDLAAEFRVNLDFELAKFRDYYRATGTARKDWDATLNNWIRNAAERKGNVTPLHPDSVKDDDYYRRLPLTPPQLP